MTIPAKQFMMSFTKKEKLTNDIYAFYFARQHVDFTFEAGQYVRISIPHSADERGSSRYFTIASSPTELAYVMIVTRKGSSSFKEALFCLHPGSSILFFGPIGTFIL